MKGYTIDPAASAQAIEQLEELLGKLKAEIAQLSAIDEDVLSDVNWQGPNKQDYQNDFNAYLDAARGLLDNGNTHLSALQGIATSYIENER